MNPFPLSRVRKPESSKPSVPSDPLVDEVVESATESEVEPYGAVIIVSGGKLSALDQHLLLRGITLDKVDLVVYEVACGG